MYCLVIDALIIISDFSMTGVAYGGYNDDDDDVEYLGAGDYSTDSDNAGLMMSGGEETDDASETESYNHQVKINYYFHNPSQKSKGL